MFLEMKDKRQHLQNAPLLAIIFFLQLMSPTFLLCVVVTHFENGKHYTTCLPFLICLYH